MKKVGVIIIILVSFSFSGIAQNVLDGIYTKDHVPARKPVPYNHLREADMAWSKKVWRLLDLKEKINHPLYYPTTPMDDRKSLVQLMLDGIKDDGISVYAFDTENEFATTLTLDEVMLSLGAGKDSSIEVDPVTLTESTVYKDIDPRPDEVTRMLMKEEWYFDKQRAMMQVRIIGLCPIRRFEKTLTDGSAPADDEEKQMTLKTLFWAYFPAYRGLFAKHEVFNPYNDAERRTFDDIFFKRRFSSHIYRVTNVFDNRQIEQYKRGEDLLLEAEKLEEFIFKMEHDLWEF